MSSTHKVHLEVFEGPLELLLHLIKKEDINIYDIPVSLMLGQYLEYVQLAQDLNIDLAGEFLEMAAELAYIKSKMLLPEITSEEDEGPDPRADLVARLLEYERYKKGGQVLMQRPMLGRDVFKKSETEDLEAGEMTLEVDVGALLSAFQDLLRRLPQEQFHDVHVLRIGVAQRVMELTEKLRGRDKIAFDDLFEGSSASGGSRAHLVVTFLSILEMAKQRLLKIVQDQVFHKIYLCSLISDEGENHGI